MATIASKICYKKQNFNKTVQCEDRHTVQYNERKIIPGPFLRGSSYVYLWSEMNQTWHVRTISSY